MIRHIVLSVLALSVLAFAGCTDQLNNPVAPMQEQTVAQGGVQFSSVPDLVEHLKVVKLPKAKTKKDKSLASKFFSAKDGGSLDAKLEYINVHGKSTTVEAHLDIPHGALKNSQQITMVLDTADCSVRFQPEGLVFNTPLKLDYKVHNSKMIAQPLGFYYDSEKGFFTLLPGKIKVDKDGKNFEATDCQVPHFSRYAFGR